jgi:hypothetical protein
MSGLAPLLGGQADIKCAYSKQPTIGQACITGNQDDTDPNTCSIAFQSCEFIDDSGVQRNKALNFASSFSCNKMVRVDFSAFAHNGGFDYLINLFF